MDMGKLRFFFLFLLVLSFCHVSPSSASTVDKKSYIIHMSKSQMPDSYAKHRAWYDSSLKSVSDSAEIIYVYDTVVHGFSTRLSEAEAAAMASQPGILSVVPEARYELHTTRTPLFLGLDQAQAQGMLPAADSGTDLVIGVFDTGVWPESKSFDDTGMGSVPASWKGACETGKSFPAGSCNRKLIGARSFSKGYEAVMGPINEALESKSPRDDDGHGTHTSTTAAGSAVAEASLFGYAKGTARGMATRARVAAYKVCWLGGCFSSDILAAMEMAVSDGVDVMSLSIGGGAPDYFRDSVAVGSFAAMEKGIFVSCSAGNAGPGAFTLSNQSPWLTTVGAGTLDRDFPAYVILGNGRNFSGVSLYSGKLLADTQLPFVYAGNISNTTNGNLCMTGSLPPAKVAGKIVLCDRGVSARTQKGLVVRDAGGAGMILANTDSNGEELVADAHLLPATGVGQRAGDTIKAYLFSDPSATATISFGGTKIGVQPSPVVAAFSSRGPNSITPELLKPDLVAPGVDILAGWSGAVGPTGLSADKRQVDFNIISGTSMSCPHVSGLAALIKGTHPAWSPAAIRSALMTTAYSAYKNGEALKDVATGRTSTPFDMGAGHVDPLKALDPGVVYDATVDDYLDFLCALNYTPSQISILAKRSYACDTSKKYAIGDLNYPSFAVPFMTSVSGGGGSGGVTTLKYTRTLTNVGEPGTYKASVSSQLQSVVKIAVEPDTLSFSKENEKKTFTVSFSAASQPSGTASWARLEWTDGKHVVGSPIALTWT